MLAALSHLNYLHVLVAVVAYYAIGFLWYGPMSPIGKIWMKETNTPADGGGANMALIMVGTLITTFFIVTGEAVFLMLSPGVGETIQLVILISFIFGGVMAMNYLYQRKSTTLFLIDFAYQFIGMLVAGIILTVWR